MGAKGKSWKSPVCKQSGAKYRPEEGILTGHVVGQRACPVCRRTVFISEQRRWPTHGVYKMSFKYGEYR